MQTKFKYFLVVALFITVLTACEKQYDTKASYTTDLATNTNIKVFNATLNSARNYVYSGSTPLTGASISYAGTSSFPANNSYASITAGNINLIIKDTLPTTTQLPLNFSSTFEAGKFYSIFMYDTLTATKYKIVTDQIIVPTDSSVRFRFVNLFYSSTPVPNVDVFSWKANANIATNIATNDVTVFKDHSFRLDTLYFRAAGTTTELIKYYYSGLTSTRSYTLIMRGRYQNSGVQAVPRTLSLYNTY